MIKTLCVAAFLSVAVMTASTNAQQIFQESFESAPGSSYALTTAFDDGGFDYFGQFAVPDNTNGARDDFQTGWDGAFGIHSQDNDGEGGSPVGTVSIPNINIAGFTNLSTTVSLGAIASEAIGFDNFEAADGDGIVITASIDGGAATTIAQFSPPAVGAGASTPGAGDLFLDPDFDGVGTGAALSVDLADFTFAIAGTGSVLDLNIELTSTGGFEPLALDNVRVFATAIPEPSSAAVVGLLGLAGVCRRRRS